MTSAVVSLIKDS